MAVQSTTGGTEISNTAAASFIDSAGVTDSVNSNTVTTKVNTVYNFQIKPDNTKNPTGSDGSAGTYADAGTDGQIDNTHIAGEQVCFAYTIENNSNKGINVNLLAQQDNSDDFDLDDLKVYIDNGTIGTFDSGTDTEVTGPVSLDQSDNVSIYDTPADSTIGDDDLNLIVCGTIPVGTEGSKVANIDLTATNATAIGDVDQTNNIANVTFENNNLAQVTVKEESSIGIAKNIDNIDATTSSVLPNGDGTYDIQMTFTVENFGNTTVDNIQITDDLDGNLGTGASGEPVITAFNVIGGSLAANTSLNVDTTNDVDDINNGATNVTNLLAGTDSLAPGDVETFTLTVTVDFKATATNPDGVVPSDLANVATVTGNPPTGTVTDCSVNGTDPDPDGLNGPADGPDNGTDASSPADANDECSETPIPLSENPQLGVSKELGTITTEGSGSEKTYIIPINIYVQNLGNVRIDDIQITENLIGDANSTFPAGSTVTIDTSPTSNASPELPGNANFDGNIATGGDINLLDSTAPAFTAVGSDTDRSLDVGQTAIVGFVIRVKADVSGSPYQNLVNVSGETPTGETPVTDCSVPGNTPDPNGDGDPGVGPDNNGGNDECAPTPIPLEEGPSIGLAKELVGSVVDNNNGTFTATFRFVVENMGNVALTNVSITDDLAVTFGIPTSGVDVISVSDPISTDMTPNTDYNGGVNGTAALDGTTTPVSDIKVAEVATLGIGASASAEVSVTFDPNDAAGPFQNSANTSGTPPTGPPVPNCSVNGSNPDVDGNGVPDSCSPTPVPIPSGPAIGIAKDVADQSGASPTFTVSYDILIENIGNVTLNNVQAVDDLGAVFGTAQLDSASVALKTNGSSEADADIPNGSFDGETVTNLLQSGVTLQPTEYIILTVTAQVTIASNYGPYNNSATATGEPVSDPTNPVTDTSDDGTNVDPDGDGNPDESTGACPSNDPAENCENDPTPVTFASPALLDVQKFQRVVTDLDDCNDDADFNNTNFTQADIDTNSGVYICYHVVAQNKGDSDLASIDLNDVIPANLRDATVTGGGGGLVAGTLSARKHPANSTFQIIVGDKPNSHGTIATSGTATAVTPVCSTSGTNGVFAAGTCTFTGVNSAITDVKAETATLEADPDSGGTDGAILELNFYSLCSLILS